MRKTSQSSIPIKFGGKEEEKGQKDEEKEREFREKILQD